MANKIVNICPKCSVNKKSFTTSGRKQAYCKTCASEIQRERYRRAEAGDVIEKMRDRAKQALFDIETPVLQIATAAKPYYKSLPLQMAMNTMFDRTIQYLNIQK